MGVKDPNVKICTFMPARSPETTSLDIHPGIFSAVCRRRELLTFKGLQGRLEADVNTSIFQYFSKQVPYLLVPESQVPVSCRVVQWLVQRFRSERLRVRSRRSATFTPSAHVRRQSLPVWPPTLNNYLYLYLYPPCEQDGAWST